MTNEKQPSHFWRTARSILYIVLMGLVGFGAGAEVNAYRIYKEALAARVMRYEAYTGEKTFGCPVQDKSPQASQTIDPSTVAPALSEASKAVGNGKTQAENAKKNTPVKSHTKHRVLPLTVKKTKQRRTHNDLVLS